MVFITVQFLDCLAPYTSKQNPVNFEPLGVSPRMSDGGLVPWSARWKNTGFLLRYLFTNLDYPEKGGALQ